MSVSSPLNSSTLANPSTPFYGIGYTGGNLTVSGNLQVTGTSNFVGAVTSGALTSTSLNTGAVVSTSENTGALTATSIVAGNLLVPPALGMGTRASPLSISVGATSVPFNMVGNKAWVTITNTNAPQPAIIVLVNADVSSGNKVPFIYEMTPQNSGFPPVPPLYRLFDSIPITPNGLSIGTTEATLSLCIVLV